MTVALEENQKMAESTEKEKQILPHEYGCQILLEKTTLEVAKDPSFPTDAYLVWYIVKEKEYIDLIRCNRKTNLFDMYYDKYGSGSIQKIDFGYGKVNPRNWGIKKPERKKRK